MDFLDRLIDLAFEEDLGASSDLTTEYLVPQDANGTAQLWAKESMVLAGSAAFARAFTRFDPAIQVSFRHSDGEPVGPRTHVADVAGPLRSLLIAERTALNLIQRTCGIATMAKAAAKVVEGSGLKILDTRKTAPGMRALAKQAARAGGAVNHRFGLFDGILIKDNHIAAVGGSVRKALELARANRSHLLKVEIEVTQLSQIPEAIDGGADVVLLDNMGDSQIEQAVRLAGGRVELEVSGGITLERLSRLARLGVGYVSIGALTHSARSMDLSLEIVSVKAPRSEPSPRPSPASRSPKARPPSGRRRSGKSPGGRSRA